MNVETVETSGVDASSPDFAKVVNSWGNYAQKTYSACFADSDGYILSRVAKNPDGSNKLSSPEENGYYEDVPVLPSGGDQTTETYYLVKKLRQPGGEFASYDLKATIEPGKTQSYFVDMKDDAGNVTQKSALGLSGSIYSDVLGGDRSGNRSDNMGWWGTGLINPDEFQADNIDASFHLVQGGNLDEGFCFMVNYSDVHDIVDGQSVPRLTGYFMSITCHNNKAVRTLWRLDDYMLDKDWTSSYGTTVWCAPGYGVNDLYYAGYQNTGIPVHKSSAVTKATVTQKPTTISALATWVDDSKDIDYRVTADGKSIKITRNDKAHTPDASHPSVANDADRKFATSGTTRTDQNGVQDPYFSSNCVKTQQGSNGVIFNNPLGETTVADIEITENANNTSTTYSDKVSGKKVTVDKPNIAKGSYGFWGENCEQGNQALITNLNVAITKTKSFGDIVYEPSWTDGALHMLINMDTKSDPTMLGKRHKRSSS